MMIQIAHMKSVVETVIWWCQLLVLDVSRYYEFACYIKRYILLKKVGKEGVERVACKVGEIRNVWNTKEFVMKHGHVIHRRIAMKDSK